MAESSVGRIEPETRGRVSDSAGCGAVMGRVAENELVGRTVGETSGPEAV